MSLEERLGKLQLLLGKPVSLVDPPEATESPASMEPVEQTTDSQPQDAANSGNLAHSTDASRHQRSPSELVEDRARARRHQEAFDNSAFRVGEQLGEHVHFCPLKTMVTYPERYIGKANKPLAKPFFEKILLGRVWDFFYLHDPRDSTRDPYLLVPTTQFEAFLDDINAKLGISLKIPNGPNEVRFALKFGQGGTPRPRYLRRSEDETALDIRPWPPINSGDIQRFDEASMQMKDDWLASMKLVKTGLVGKGGKGNSEKAARKKRDREQMLRDTQGYLGLRGSMSPQNVVFVCVDVEAIERPPYPISEIGLAILDTNDIRKIAPGPGGQNWWTSINCHHLRVREYSGLRNSQYVHGCPDAFDFGSSTFPRKKNVRKAIMAILEPHTSRNLVLVGHDIAQDIKYFDTLGIHLLDLKNFTRQVDTQEMCQAWQNETQGRGLGKILSQLEIPSKNLHNAGNDAYYTVCAMFGIAIEQIREHEAKLKEKHELIGTEGQ
ncbi:hypothetical protein B0J13DRAFT_535844 [Dactylonectria estremocensis]|uniref:Gfd2/YDR514C-like C-terminal domain-containing protein n=1 Tax=Dactylonectria estremocensis TaxID=1079267 RepID=A0A9P9FJ16_9HYPO|nr:hypothetical protein B0J13DRAFT_535844 [Dactylonectria estremocensis]